MTFLANPIDSRRPCRFREAEHIQKPSVLSSHFAVNLNILLKNTIYHIKKNLNEKIISEFSTMSGA